MNSFSFYRNYFDTLSAVPEEQRLECYEALMRYMFLCEEPQGMAKIIIQALSVSLEKSKKRASAGATSNEIKQEQTETNEIKTNQTKSNEIKQEQTTLKNKRIKELKNESIKDKSIKESKDESIKGNTDLFLAQKSNPRANGTNPRNVASVVSLISERDFPSVIDEAVKDWVRYKIEKRQGYKPTGFKSFLSEVENRLNEFGEKAVVDIIRLSMSNNWQGVAWDKLKSADKKSGYDMAEHLRQIGGF